MAEYIDKCKLYEEIANEEDRLRQIVLTTPSDSPEFDIYMGRLTATTQIKFLIAYTPPEDVAPVVHQKWMEIEENIVYEDGFWTHKEHCFRCPICFYECTKKLSECPNCKAKMDLED